MNSWWAQQSTKRGELEKRSEWLWQWNLREVVVRPASGEDPAQLCWFVNNRPYGSLLLDAACEVRVNNDCRLVIKSGPDAPTRRELHFRLRGGLRSPASAPESLQSWCDAIEEAARPQNTAEAVATAGVRLVSLAAGPRAARSLASWLGIRRKSTFAETTTVDEAAAPAERSRRASGGLWRLRGVSQEAPPGGADASAATGLGPRAGSSSTAPSSSTAGPAAASMPAAGGKAKGRSKAGAATELAGATVESAAAAGGRAANGSPPSPPPAAPAPTGGPARSVCARPRYWSNRAAKQSSGWAAERLDSAPLLAALEAALRVADPASLTKGRDVREGGSYSRLGLAAAWRVENPHLWDKYGVERSALQSLAALARFPAVSLRPELLEATARLEETKLLPAVNEVWLLHGTRPETVVPIMSGGMNERFSDGHFGGGTYLAEVADKINQYVVSENACRSGGPLDELHRELYGPGAPRPANVFYAFVCRALLGYAVRTKDGATDLDSQAAAAAGGGAASGKPAPLFAHSKRRELAFIPAEKGLPAGERYHSILVETGGKVKRHREFVVFHSERIYPEYLVAFHRLP